MVWDGHRGGGSVLITIMPNYTSFVRSILGLNDDIKGDQPDLPRVAIRSHTQSGLCLLRRTVSWTICLRPVMDLWGHRSPDGWSGGPSDVCHPSGWSSSLQGVPLLDVLTRKSLRPPAIGSPEGNPSPPTDRICFVCTTPGKNGLRPESVQSSTSHRHSLRPQPLYSLVDRRNVPFPFKISSISILLTYTDLKFVECRPDLYPPLCCILISLSDVPIYNDSGP